MNFTINQLRIFLKVAECQSITKAADELHLTQPAVSIQLKNFQNQFDVPLTEVINKRIFITDFGKEMAKTAEQVLHDLAELNVKASSFKGLLTGKLKISVVSTGKYIIPYYLSNFLKAHPAVELSLNVTNKAKVVEDLENNEVDFSLVSILPEHLSLNKVGLMQNRLLLIGGAGEKQNNKKRKPAYLESVPLIFREKGSATRQVMEGYLKANGLSVYKKIELTSNEAVKQAVIAGLGYSVMPLIGIKNELLYGQLQIIPIQGLPILSEWNLVWLKDKRISPVAQAFLAFIKQESEPIKQRYFSWADNYI
ncbi:MAG: LysR family transcriptional regulator [Flavobacteriales bacterium]|nr:LysR family transcriptional regulator [Flavobacteriales bacterium]